MKKLKTIIVSLVMCLCIGVSCFGLSGCADSRTKEELASLKTQVEQLETKNSELETKNEAMEVESAKLERDKVLSKIYEARMFTADEWETNQTSSYPDSVYIIDPVMTAYHLVTLYRTFNFDLNKVYTYYNDEYGAKTSFSIIAEDN